MSETIAAEPAAASQPRATEARAVALRPSIRVRRWLLVASPVLAGLFVILGVVADPAAGVSGPDMWRLYTEHPDALQWKSFGLHWSYTFWALPAVGAFAFIRSRGAWLANIAGLFGILGIAMLPGMLIVDFYDSAIGQVAGVETIEAVYGVFNGMWAVDAMVLPGNISLMVCLPLAAAAFWRAGLARWWGFAAVTVGTVVLFVSGFVWWGGVVMAAAGIVFALELALGLRRADRSGVPAGA